MLSGRSDLEAHIASAHSDMASLASALLRRNERHVLLQTQDLVGEAVLRLLKSEEISVSDRSHFLALTARTMRRVLVDAARARNANKRKGKHVTLISANGDSSKAHAVDLLRLDHALKRLKAIDPDRATLVELRYFAGLTLEETADAMDVSISSVQRSWNVARIWLREAVATVEEGKDGFF
ncbi:sigma-70 family RNA polymerase sigma factor [Parvularcula sp. ZS-1/3]|uniref:Sigma-70 family RNA polymerase sigma factor n=1 Tax=Parvularcula mediterranea TaxID=2732508 RepID=A0A7Y3RKQ2_9PROT|nr:ECF-type sigma factor [Parvularcula mediterranea]NNU15147.1 sigma-70 family RNA polymerase sigma factor [Parvularcula mediterranea]